MFKILSTNSCWKNIYQMHYLEGSGTPVLYTGRTVLKGKSERFWRTHQTVIGGEFVSQLSLPADCCALRWNASFRHCTQTETWEIFILSLADITFASKLPTPYVNWRLLWWVLSVAYTKRTLFTLYSICHTNRITLTAFSCAEATVTPASLAEAKGIIFRRRF
jgi:hypothetical protein